MPRVRPVFLLALLLVAGALFLRHGARQGWFVGALGAGTFPRLQYALWWGAVGLACGCVCTLAWAWLSRGGPRWKGWVGSLLALALMIGGGQVAEGWAERQVVLVIDGIQWDADGYRIHVLSKPAVRCAVRRGHLGIEASVSAKFVADCVCGMIHVTGPTCEEIRADGLVEIGWVRATWVEGMEGTSAGLYSYVPMESDWVPRQTRASLVSPAGRSVGPVWWARFHLPPSPVMDDRKSAGGRPVGR